MTATITLAATLSALVGAEERLVERYKRDMAGQTFAQIADNMGLAVAGEYRLGWYQRALKVARDHDDAAAARWLENALGDALADSRQYADAFQNGVITARRSAARHALSSLRTYLNATEVLDRIY